MAISNTHTSSRRIVDPYLERFTIPQTTPLSLIHRPKMQSKIDDSYIDTKTTTCTSSRRLVDPYLEKFTIPRPAPLYFIYRPKTQSKIDDDVYTDTNPTITTINETQTQNFIDDDILMMMVMTETLNKQTNEYTSSQFQSCSRAMTLCVTQNEDRAPEMFLFRDKKTFINDTRSIIPNFFNPVFKGMNIKKAVSRLEIELIDINHDYFMRDLKHLSHAFHNIRELSITTMHIYSDVFTTNTPLLLRKIPTAAPNLTRLQLNFSCNSFFSDGELEDITYNVFANCTALKWIKLDFTKCHQFHGLVLRNMLRKIANSTRVNTLILDFYECTSLSNKAIIQMFSRFPVFPHLKHLFLGFKDCTELRISALRSIRPDMLQRIPRLSKIEIQVDAPLQNFLDRTLSKCKLNDYISEFSRQMLSF